MEVYYHPKVPGEACRFLEHYDQVSKKLGDAFWSELTDAIENARANPHAITLIARGVAEQT